MRLNRDILMRLCAEYNFRYEILGLFCKITSKLGTYYILDEDTEGRPIKLYHENLYGKSGFHKHGKHNSLRCIFSAISSHDKIYDVGSRNNVYTRMNDIFAKLHAVS